MPGASLFFLANVTPLSAAHSIFAIPLDFCTVFIFIFLLALPASPQLKFSQRHESLRRLRDVHVRSARRHHMPSYKRLFSIFEDSYCIVHSRVISKYVFVTQMTCDTDRTGWTTGRPDDASRTFHFRGILVCTVRSTLRSVWVIIGPIHRFPVLLDPTCRIRQSCS